MNFRREKYKHCNLLRHIFSNTVISLAFLVTFNIMSVINLKDGRVFAEEDPFQKYLNEEVPEIVKTIGENTADGVNIKKVIFHSRDIDGQAEDIYAIIGRPAEPGNYPGILSLHGGGGYAEEKSVMNWAQQGYIVISFDEPGIANPAYCPNSTGPWKNMEYGANRFLVHPSVESSTIFSGVVAEIKAFNLLASQSGIIKERIGLTGASWGGYSTTMLSGLLGDRVCAAYSVFGCGYYDKGSTFIQELSKISEDDRSIWLKYLDAGRRASQIKAKFFLAAAVKDHYFWPPAVMETLKDITGESNHLFAPKATHSLEGAEGGDTSLPYFEFYLKDKGGPFPVINIESFIPQADGSKVVVFNVASSTTAQKGTLYYSKPGEDWENREWSEIEAKPLNNNRFTVTLPAVQVKDNVDWYVQGSDARPVTAGSMLYSSSAVTNQEATTPFFYINISLLNGSNPNVEYGNALHLSLNESVQLKCSGRAARGDIVNFQDSQVTFTSSDNNIVEIDSKGTVKPKAEGNAAITVSISKDGVDRKISVPVHIGTTLDKIGVYAVESNPGAKNEVLSESGNKRMNINTSMQLKAVGQTMYGVEFELASYHYESLNPDILGVYTSGNVTAKNKGVGKIKVAGVFGGVEKSTVIPITVLDLSNLPNVFDLKDFIKDINNWSMSGKNTKKEEKGDGVTFSTPDGLACYQNKKFQDEIVDFNMETDSSSGWCGISIRQKDPDKYYTNTTMYLVVLSKDKIELHRYNEGTKTLLGKFEKPNIFVTGKKYHVQFGAVNEADAVRLILNVDGSNIFYQLDNDSNKITDAGYFGILAKKPITVSEYEDKDKITVMVDGKELDFKDQKPVIQNDRTLVPMRAIFERMGAQIEWRGEEETVIAKTNDLTITLKLGAMSANKNGNDIALDVPAQTINDRTMVPLRFVGEALGAQVKWIEETKTVEITTAK